MEMIVFSRLARSVRRTLVLGVFELTGERVLSEFAACCSPIEHVTFVCGLSSM